MCAHGFFRITGKPPSPTSRASPAARRQPTSSFFSRPKTFFVPHRFKLSLSSLKLSGRQGWKSPLGRGFRKALPSTKCELKVVMVISINWFVCELSGCSDCFFCFFL